MIGLSLDVAPTHSAIVIWYEDRMLDRDTFKEKGCPALKMSKWLIDGIENAHINDGVAWVAVETVYMGKNAKVSLDLGRILGALAFMCDRLDIPYFEGTSAEIDSACGIPHKDRKTYTRSLAERYFKIEGKLNEDECDAIAVGIWGYGKYKEYQILQNGLDMS